MTCVSGKAHGSERISLIILVLFDWTIPTTSVYLFSRSPSSILHPFQANRGARGSSAGNGDDAPASAILPPPPPRPGRRRGRPDAGLHPGRAVQHERPRRRHQRHLGRRRAVRVRALAAHPPPLPCAPLGGGARAAARRHRRGQRPRRRARHALRPRRARRQRQGGRGRRPAGGRRRARPLRAGRHAHRQLDAGHGAVRADDYARQDRPGRLRRRRRAGRHAVVPGGGRHHEAQGRRALPGAHGGARARRPPRPRPAGSARHPGRDCDCAVQRQVPRPCEGSSKGSQSGSSKCQVRRCHGAAHCERPHASYHRSSSPAWQHASHVVLRNVVISQPDEHIVSTNMCACTQHAKIINTLD